MTWSDAARKLVESRAVGRCEYCLLHQSDAVLAHEIDHIISRKHQGNDDPDNLAFACYLCNRYKGSDIASINPGTQELLRLFHPRRDEWPVHFRITGAILEPLTAVAGGTARLLRLNHVTRVIERELLQSLGRYPKLSRR